MEITNYVDYIKEQLNEFTGKNDLKWKQENLGSLILENKKISLEFLTEYRVDDAIGITITNKNKKEYYTIFFIRKAKGFDDISSYMSQSEIDSLNAISDPIKNLVYEFSIFIKKHCQDIMSGDFSNVGKGLPAYNLY